MFFIRYIIATHKMVLRLIFINIINIMTCALYSLFINSILRIIQCSNILDER